jgi:hypothetical protein
MIEVDVVLVDGTDQQEFVESYAQNSSVDVVNLLAPIPNVITLSVEETFLDTLKQDDRVESTHEAEEPIEVSLPPIVTQTGSVVVERLLSTLNSGPGANYMPLQLYVDTDVMPESDIKLGNDPADDENLLANVTYSSRFFGKHVDIVALEAGSPDNSYDSHHTGPHPDFADPDTGLSRYTPVDWPNSLPGQTNNAATRGQTFFSNHTIGVLSAAAGTYCGFAKKANLFAAYTIGNATARISDIIEWHNQKQINPETGLKNPTIMLAEYQYAYQKRRYAPLDSIESFTHKGVTTNRPAGGWGDDLTPFVNANLIPFKVQSPQTNQWMWTIPWGQGNISPGPNAALKLALESAWDAGITCVNAAGNGGEVYVKRDDPEYTGTSFVIGQNQVYFRSNVNASWLITDFSTFAGGTGGTTIYPFQSYGPHGCLKDKSIDVAAGQNSETYPILDGYSTRGPGIDIVGLGGDTYTSEPDTTFTDGGWGYFGGTSCATPTVAGKLACEMEKYYHFTGRWPTNNQAKEILINQGKDKVITADPFDWANTPHADGSNYRPTEMEDDSPVNSVDQGYSLNGNIQLSNLAGTTTKRAFFNAKGFDRVSSQGRRPQEGGVYPRPKIRRS